MNHSLSIEHQLKRRLLLAYCSGAALALAGCAKPPAPPPPEDPDLLALKRLRFEDTPDGARAVLDSSILFEFGKAEFSNDSAELVMDLLRPAFQRARGLIIVEGHTDGVGTAAVNQDLSRRRAERVREELIKRQIAPERVVARGMGSSKPRRTPEVNERDRRLNRRAEFLFPGETVASLGGRELEQSSDARLEHLSRLLGAEAAASAAPAPQRAASASP